MFVRVVSVVILQDSVPSPGLQDIKPCLKASMHVKYTHRNTKVHRPMLAMFIYCKLMAILSAGRSHTAAAKIHFELKNG